MTELLNDAHGKTMIVPWWDKKKYFERENQLLDFDDILKCRVHKDKLRYIYGSVLQGGKNGRLMSFFLK